MYGAQLLDQAGESQRVVHQDGQYAVEKAIVRVNADASQHDVLFLGDNRSNVVDNTQIVLADNVERNGVGALSFASPTGFHDAVTATFVECGSVRAAFAVNLDAAAHGNKGKDVVTVNGIAATCQLVIKPLQVTVDDQFVAFALSAGEHFALHGELFSRTDCRALGYALLAFA